MKIFQIPHLILNLFQSDSKKSVNKITTNNNLSSAAKNKMSASMKRKERTLMNISYYYVRPFILRRMQIFLRRVLAKRKRRDISKIWPVYPGSEKVPPSWAGWPLDKKFALVLTHDVERSEGYEKVIKLMEVEKELGFISTFFFIPERDYTINKNLLSELKTNGFEFGVHGLKHDGKLFKNEKVFEQRSIRINHYLKEWNCSGFRAPAMHHNLKWIKSLNIKYDMSTFDTDPFEPQPDGVGTIFPFWAGNDENCSGYLEMPYTLPQDHTLFIILQEKNNRIWKEKLDWIVEKGGMVLLDVHPDYINFDNLFSNEEYPVGFYEEFLSYIKEKYNSQYWNALPSDLVKYFTEHSNLK